LLPAAFILSIVGLCLSGKSKGTSIAAVIIAIIGVIVGAVVFFAIVADGFHDTFGKSEFGKSDLLAPSSTSAIRSDESNQARSRENPFPIGQSVYNEEWQVTLSAPHDFVFGPAACSPGGGPECWCTSASPKLGDRVPPVRMWERPTTGATGHARRRLGEILRLYARRMG
jgi:hypothetical protein